MKKQTSKTANKTKKVANKKTRFKLDPKREKQMLAVVEAMEDADDDSEGDTGGLIAQILKLYTKGFLKKEIVAFGYNKSTVYRQTGDLDKYKKRPALQYYGHDLFEARVQKLMKAKGITRDKAVTTIMEKDLA